MQKVNTDCNDNIKHACLAYGKKYKNMVAKN